MIGAEDHAGWLKTGVMGKKKYIVIRGIMLEKYKAPGEALETCISLMNCDIFANYEKCKIQLPKWKETFIAPNAESLERWVKAFHYASKRVFDQHYRIVQQLGPCTGGMLKTAESRSTGETVLIRCVKKDGYAPDTIAKLRNDAMAMMNIQSPQILQTVDIFDEEAFFYIVMEHQPGGTLKEVLEERSQLTEEQVRLVMMEIFYGLSCLHDMEIVHHSVRLENIVCVSDQFPLGVKLLDFGFGALNALDGAAGKGGHDVDTWTYVAPEQISRKPFSAPVDLWSAGILMFRLLTGEFPFQGSRAVEVIKKIKDGNISYGENWESFSAPCRKTLMGLLDLNPATRLTARAAQQEVWTQGPTKAIALVGEPRVNDAVRAIQGVFGNPKGILSLGKDSGRAASITPSDFSEKDSTMSTRTRAIQKSLKFLRQDEDFSRASSTSSFPDDDQESTTVFSDPERSSSIRFTKGSMRGSESNGPLSMSSERSTQKVRRGKVNRTAALEQDQEIREWV